MLEYDRIHLSEDIDVNKTSNSRECSFCHYYLLDLWMSRYVYETE